MTLVLVIDVTLTNLHFVSCYLMDLFCIYASLWNFAYCPFVCSCVVQKLSRC